LKNPDRVEKCSLHCGQNEAPFLVICCIALQKLACSSQAFSSANCRFPHTEHASLAHAAVNVVVFDSALLTSDELDGDEYLAATLARRHALFFW
jgi:hypothetical protein